MAHLPSPITKLPWCNVEELTAFTADWEVVKMFMTHRVTVSATVISLPETQPFLPSDNSI